MSLPCLTFSVAFSFLEIKQSLFQDPAEPAAPFLTILGARFGTNFFFLRFIPLEPIRVKEKTKNLQVFEQDIPPTWKVPIIYSRAPLFNPHLTV